MWSYGITLEFKRNDGTNVSTTVNGYTATLQIPNTVPTCEDENYVFLGWDTNKDVDVTQVTYKWVGDGFSPNEYTFTGTETTTATLYAIWVE